ncbi:MAG: NAD(P)H-dependent oxidoreductase [Clostridiales bacterium]|jgi:putative sterol carrier protein/multimeric flavodoxin WrbA|nr:NAD(P)H-dependent oxidoreductase [Clostridiales bacterium]
MKIAIVTAAGPNDKITKTVSDTLAELGEDVMLIKLDRMKPAFFGMPTGNGDTPDADIHNAIYEIMSAGGAVFIAPSVMGGISALMKAFLEHFSLSQFSKGLLDKNCMLAVIGDENGGTRQALEQLADIVARLGGNDAIRIGIPSRAKEEDILEIVLEKQTEDYYRILRQNRKFFSLADDISAGRKHSEAPELSADPGENAEKLRELRERAANQQLTPEQEEDVDEITRVMTERFNNPQEPQAPPKPRLKSCKQLTASMPHYYNPQLAGGVKAAISINITGEENFSGTLIINESFCAFEETVQAEADMFISADSKVWTEVLTGKYTTHKAFMVGSLKVRGNFLLLAKLDQLFSRMDP